MGLGYVLLDGLLARLTAEGAALDRLRRLDALDVARGFTGASPMERTIGFAAINALSRTLFDRAGFVPAASTDSTGLLDPRAGDHVGMIGLFGLVAGAEWGTNAHKVALRRDDYPGFASLLAEATRRSRAGAART